MRKFIILLNSILLAGCAATSVTPLSQDTMRIATEQPGGADCSPAYVTGDTFQRASEETIRRGYERFMVIDSEKSNDSSGCRQVFIVKMFKKDDPAGAKALPARK